MAGKRKEAIDLIETTTVKRLKITDFFGAKSSSPQHESTVLEAASDLGSGDEESDAAEWPFSQTSEDEQHDRDEPVKLQLDSRGEDVEASPISNSVSPVPRTTSRWKEDYHQEDIHCEI